MNVKGTKYTRRKVNMCAKTWGIAKFLNSCEGESDLFNELYVTVFSRNPPLHNKAGKGKLVTVKRSTYQGCLYSKWPTSRSGS